MVHVKLLQSAFHRLITPPNLPNREGESAGSLLNKLEADLTFDHLTKRNILGTEFFERLHQGSVASAQLLNAARDYVDQQTGIWNDGVCFF